MSFRFFFSLLFLTGCPVLLPAQQVVVHAYMEQKPSDPGSDTIFYRFGSPLDWSDFQGVPRAGYYAGAVTSSGFAFDSRVSLVGRDIHLDVGIYSFFSKHDSWRKPEITSAYHLLHEQHHFDITRLGAQKFLEAVQRAHFTPENYEQLLSDLFDKAYDENAAMQRQYDAETQHSINTRVQLEWNDRIAAAIRRLRDGTSVRP